MFCLVSVSVLICVVGMVSIVVCVLIIELFELFCLVVVLLNDSMWIFDISSCVWVLMILVVDVLLIVMLVLLCFRFRNMLI